MKAMVARCVLVLCSLYLARAARDLLSGEHPLEHQAFSCYPTYSVDLLKLAISGVRVLRDTMLMNFLSSSAGRITFEGNPSVPRWSGGLGGVHRSWAFAP